MKVLTWVSHNKRLNRSARTTFWNWHGTRSERAVEGMLSPAEPQKLKWTTKHPFGRTKMTIENSWKIWPQFKCKWHIYRRLGVTKSESQYLELLSKYGQQTYQVKSEPLRSSVSNTVLSAAAHISSYYKRIRLSRVDWNENPRLELERREVGIRHRLVLYHTFLM